MDDKRIILIQQRQIARLTALAESLISAMDRQTDAIGKLVAPSASWGKTCGETPNHLKNRVKSFNVGKHAAGRLLDGVEHNGVPA